MLTMRAVSAGQGDDAVFRQKSDLSAACKAHLSRSPSLRMLTE